MIKMSFHNIFPPIQKFNLKSVRSDAVTYIGTAGFEDRSLKILQLFAESKMSLRNAIGIEYSPFDQRNRKQEFESSLNEIGVRNKLWVLYDRHNPETFLSSLDDIRELCLASDITIVDISSMSKLLIILLLHALRGLQIKIQIVYCEAETYHPTKMEFDKVRSQSPRPTPAFLTYDVYKVVVARTLYGSSIQGTPTLLIAFPTFNYVEMVALIDEIIPERTSFFEGKPHLESNLWRQEAVRWLNRHVERDVLYSVKETRWTELSTFHYVETIRNLEDIYNEFRSSYSIILSPTGSKLQAVGVCFFKQMHPDVHIVYPITKKFAEEYTDGVIDIWNIVIDDYAAFANILDRYRWSGIEKLKKTITEAEKQ